MAEQNEKTVRWAFDILLRGKIYGVYDIESKPHDDNGEESTYWIFQSDKPESGNPPIDSPHWEPHSRYIERLCFDIQFKQHTYSKEKWDETNYRNTTSCKIICNNRPIYEFATIGGSNGLSYAMAKSQYLITQIFEHPFNFLYPEKEDGRKIWWHGLPAFVKVWRKDNPWEIGIVPDYSSLNKDAWWAELSRRETKLTQLPPDDIDEVEADKGDFEDSKREDFINWGDALSDQHIDWSRM